MNLLKSLATVSFITLFSRALGFTRDAIIARIFGIGMITDAFFLAFKFPNLLRRIFAEGAFSQAFIPILLEYKKQKEENVTRTFIAYIAGLLIVTLVLVSILGVLAAPWVVMIVAPGFTNIEEQFSLTISLLRITFPYILLISLASLVGAILNTYNQFSVPAFSPILLNLTIIGFMILAVPFFHPPVMALAWSVIAGGILQLLSQLLYLKKIGMLIMPRLQLHNTGVSRVLHLMGPAIIAVSVSQCSLIINTIFASFLMLGSVSWIYYADRLMEFPLGVLGVALNTVLFPALSRCISFGYYDEYDRLMDWGLRLCFILALPCSVALGIISKPLIIILFQYGNFSDFDVLMTQKALIAYSIGLMGLILVKVLTSSFYSRQNIKTPVRIALITFIFTQLMNLTFIGSLKHAGLSLSIGLGACFNAGLLYWQLYRKKLFQPQPGWLMFLFRVGLAVVIMSMTLLGLMKVFPNLEYRCISYRILWLIGVIILGSITYFSTLRVLGVRLHNFFTLGE